MSDSFAFFEIFNRIEALVWFFLAGLLPIVVRSISTRQRIWIFAASLGFIAFGISDLLEAPTRGDVPRWLWLMKVSCATFLMFCRFGYIGWENFSLSDRYFLFGIFCLSASVVIYAFSGKRFYHSIRSEFSPSICSHKKALPHFCGRA